jgi:hypothetical protein
MLLLTDHVYVRSVYEVRKREYRRNPAITGRELELWLPLAVLLECLGATDELEAARQRFTAQYRFAAAHLSAFDEEVVKVVYQALQEQGRLVLAPKEIAARMDAAIFHEGLDDIQNPKGRPGGAGH